jgi:uncharacterized protein YndB with AHSA1/START domain
VTDSATAGQDAVSLGDAGPMIVGIVRLPDCTPDRALAAFTDPVVLASWWRGELITDLLPGGQYSVLFPAIPARLAGQVISYVPGSSLWFSWAWEDTPHHPDSAVIVRAEPADGGGAVLTIAHGPHTDDEAGRAAHAVHWAGWEFFLPRLPAAVASSG